MGNCKSTPTTTESSGHITLVRPKSDVKEALRSAGLRVLNAQQAKESSHNKYALEVDQNTLLFVMIARASGVSKAGNVVDTKEMCKTYQDKSEAKIFHAENLPMLPFLQHDEDLPMSNTAQKAFELLAHELSTLPMVEKNPIYFDTVDDADKSRFELFGSDALPAHSVYWHYWENYSTVENFAFNGLGAYYLSGVTKLADDSVPTTAVYEMNLSQYKDFAVRRVKDAEEEPRNFLSRGLSHIAQHFVKQKDSLPGPDNEELFYRYGGIFYFDALKKPLGIYWCERKTFVPLSSTDFQLAWHIFRSTMVMAATVEHHLIMTHWIVANAATVNCARYLSATHPIRRVLKPHTYGTSAVNFNSTAILAPIRGLAYRIFGFNQQGFLDMVTHSITSYNLESLQEHFDKANLPPQDRKTIPFYEDGFGLWDIIEAYIRNYVTLIYPTDDSLVKDTELQEFWAKGYLLYFGEASDLTPPVNTIAVGELNHINLIKLLTYHIFWVSGGHEFIGSIVEYLVDCQGLSPKVYRNAPADHKYETDCQSFFQALSLISLTSGNMPKLIDSWSYLFDDNAFLPPGEQRTAILNNLAMFQTRLVTHRDTVNTRNLKRAQPLNVFSKHLESSVSV